MGVPHLPQELTDKIIDEVAKRSIPSLRACALVSRAWVNRSQRHIFRKVLLQLDDQGFLNWCRANRPGENGMSHHITHLYHCCRHDAYPDCLAGDDGHLSDFTNVRTLWLSGVGLHHTELALKFMQLGSTVRSLWLGDCRMDINDFVNFIRSFTNLEHLSLSHPKFRGNMELKERRGLPTLKGELELDFPSYPDARPFLRELSLLPLAFSGVTLDGAVFQVGETEHVFLSSCETLSIIRIIESGSCFIDLTNLNTLEGLQLNASSVDHIHPIIQTITSKKFTTIFLDMSEDDLEEHLEHPQRWTQLDLELEALANRIRSFHESGGSRGGRRLRVILSGTSRRDFREIASYLLPKSHEYAQAKVGRRRHGKGFRLTVDLV